MHRTAPLLAVTMLVATPTLHAEGAAGDRGLERQLERMAERLEALERDNAALRTEVADLRAESGEEWLTEQRANEIRSLVQEVLSDADTRASLQSSGMTAGWDNGFFLSSPDGRFRLQISGQLQIRYVGNFREKSGPGDPTDRYRGAFENTRTRLTFRGHVFSPDFEYLVRGGFSRGGGNAFNQDSNANNVVLAEDAGGEFQLVDAWIRYRLAEQWAIRVGQYKLPFSRERLVSSANQLVIERSMLDQSLAIGRSQGIELEYLGDFLGWRTMFSDGGTDSLLQVGQLVNTFPPNTEWSVEDTEFAVTSRVEMLVAGRWGQFQQYTSPPGDPFGLLVGVAAHYQQNEWGTNADRGDWFGATADVTVMLGGASLSGAVYYHYTDANFGIFNIWGAMAQGSFYIAPKWEIFARYEFGDFDSNNNVANSPPLTVLTAGVNWYIDGQDMKWSFDFAFNLDDMSQFWASNITGWRPDGNDTWPQFVIRTQFQLLF